MDKNPKKVQLVFKKMLETRFADPITAIDLSLRHVCFGSAMGRMAFYDIKNDKDFIISDSQPELIRGVSTKLPNYYVPIHTHTTLSNNLTLKQTNSNHLPFDNPRSRTLLTVTAFSTRSVTFHASEWTLIH